MNIDNTQGIGFLNCVYGPEYEVHQGGRLSDLVDLPNAIFEASTESFYSNSWYSLAVTRRSDHSLAGLVYNTWDNIEESANSTYRSHLEQLEVEHGVLVFRPRSESWEPMQQTQSRRDMQLMLAQADGYPYDCFDGEADNETLEGLFGSATETPNVQGVPVPFESSSTFDGDSGRELVGTLLEDLGRGSKRLFWNPDSG